MVNYNFGRIQDYYICEKLFQSWSGGSLKSILGMVAIFFSGVRFFPLFGREHYRNISVKIF